MSTTPWLLLLLWRQSERKAERKGVAWCWMGSDETKASRSDTKEGSETRTEAIAFM